MLKRSAIAGVLAAFGLVALATNAQAASFKSLLAAGSPASGGAQNLIEDFSEEEIVQNDSGNATLDVGDSLRGIVNFQTIVNAKASGGSDPLGESGNNEFSGIFQTMVIAKTDTGTTDTEGNTIYRFAFGPDPAFESIYGSGAMIALYEDSTPDFTSDGGPGSADETNATNGVLFWVLGFLGTLNGEITDMDEGWIALAVDTVPADDPGDSFGAADIAFNRIVQGNDGDDLNLGVFASNFGSKGPVQFRGSAEVLFPRPGSGWPVADSSDLRFKVIVPLPAAAWAGFAMLGLLGVGRKLRRRSA